MPSPRRSPRPLLALLLLTAGCERKPVPSGHPAPSAAASPSQDARSASSAAPTMAPAVASSQPASSQPASATSGPAIEPRLTAILSPTRPTFRVELPALNVSEEAGELPPLPHACLGAPRPDGRWVVTCSSEWRTPRLTLAARDGQLEITPRGQPARLIPLPPGATLALTEQPLARATDGCNDKRAPVQARAEFGHQYDTALQIRGKGHKISLSVLSPRMSPAIVPLAALSGEKLRCRSAGDDSQVTLTCDDQLTCMLAATPGALRLTCGEDVALFFPGCLTPPRLPREPIDRRVIYD